MNWLQDFTNGWTGPLSPSMPADEHFVMVLLALFGCFVAMWVLARLK